MSQADPSGPAASNYPPSYGTGTPFLNVVGTFLIPYLIFYLAHFPNTRPLREGILPLAYIAAIRLVLLTNWNLRCQSLALYVLAVWLQLTLACLAAATMTNEIVS